MLKPVKRKGSPFYIARGSVNGRQIERSTKTDNFTLAKQRCVEIAAEIIAGNGSPDEAAPYTFRDAVTDYLNQGGSQRFLQRPLDYFGEVEVSRINNKALYEAARVIYPNAQPATINRQLFTPVSAVIQCASDNELCAPKRFKRPKSDNPRMRFLVPHEVDAIIRESQHCPNGFMPAILTFLFGQGTRLKETLTIDGRDVDLNAGYAMIYPDNNKTGEQRRITLIPKTKAALSLLPTLGHAGPLFRNVKGMGYKFPANSPSGGQIDGPLTNICQRADVEKITAHIARHTWATWFYAQTRDAVRLRSEGGWADHTSWLRYTKVGTPDLGYQAREYGWEFEPRYGNVRDHDKRQFIIK